jgi:HlyD family secretion protein
MRRAALLLWLSSATLAGCEKPGPAVYQGYIEGEYVHVASPVGGRLERLFVQRGQTVEAGASLFQLEADEEQAGQEQAEEQLKAYEAQLADLKLGKRSPELEVAEAQLAQALAAEEQAAQQLRRDDVQYEAGGIPRTQLEDSRTNYAIKAAKVRELRGQLAVSRLPARSEQIRAQSAQVEAARAVSSQSSWRLEQKHIAAAQAGRVSDTLYQPGEWVPGGSPVVRLLPPTLIKVRFFVPEGILGSLEPGRAIALQCDGCEAGLTAAVNYVADAPEYTPPVIYSNESRAKLVFMVEARPAPDQAQRLHPGQPVTVRFK